MLEYQIPILLVPFLVLILCTPSLSVVDVPCATPDGTHLPHATYCDNDLSQADCDILFPQNATNPFSPNCLDEKHADAAALCKKNCLTCCRQEAYNCYDDPKSPINCAIVDCKNSGFHAALQKYCPATCGLCLTANNNTCRDESTACDKVSKLCNDIVHGDEIRPKCNMTCGVCTPPGCRTCSAATIRFTTNSPGSKPMDNDVIDQRGPCSTRTLSCIGKSATIEWNAGARGVSEAENGILLETLMCAADGSGWQIPPDLTVITQAECSAIGPL